MISERQISLWMAILLIILPASLQGLYRHDGTPEICQAPSYEALAHDNSKAALRTRSQSETAKMGLYCRTSDGKTL